MDLLPSFQRVLEDYPIQSKYALANNNLAQFIRKIIPNRLSEFLDGKDRLITKGSPGNGNWATCPWIAIFDRLITESAQDGYYVVYLFRVDFRGFYISLNQGVTNVLRTFKGRAIDVLETRAKAYAAQLGQLLPEILIGQLDLGSSYKASPAGLYEIGSICAKLYTLDSPPTNDEFVSDLEYFLDLYLTLTNRQLELKSGDDEETTHEEGRVSWHLHRHIERNRKLANDAKRIHGYQCQVCGFDYSQHYPGIGEGFIEAHHLTPLSDLQGLSTTFHPEKDFAVLCANCHRMIHRTNDVSNIKAFRSKYFRDD